MACGWMAKTVLAKKRLLPAAASVAIAIPRALKPLAPGAVLEILATDPGAAKDFEHFCQTTGCELLEASEQPGGVLRFRLKKPG